MVAEDEAQQSATPVSGKKAPAEPVCLITVALLYSRRNIV
jgi:hypothetical protein